MNIYFLLVFNTFKPYFTRSRPVSYLRWEVSNVIHNDNSQLRFRFFIKNLVNICYIYFLIR